MKSLFACIIATVFLCGCAEVKPPQTHYYLLSPTLPDAVAFSAPLRVEAEVAQFLNHGQVIIQTTPRQIRRSHYHRWAEPLPGLIERYIERRLQARLALPLPRPTLNLIIDRFNGSTQGKVWLSGQWWNEPTSPRRFNYQAELKTGDYPQLVATLEQLLDQLCDDLARQLTIPPQENHDA